MKLSKILINQALTLLKFDPKEIPFNMMFESDLPSYYLTQAKIELSMLASLNKPIDPDRLKNLIRLLLVLWILESSETWFKKPKAPTKPSERPMVHAQVLPRAEVF